MQGNIIGQSGMFVNDSLFPIYQQLNQPIEYNGIWIKTEDNLKDVYFQTDDVRDYEFINDLPYDFDCGRATSVGSDIYLFGGEDDYDNNAYKYNSIEGTYTKLSNIPTLGLTNRPAISSKNEIYIINNQDIIYKYNISEDTYTALHSIFRTGAEGCAVTLIEDNIYIFGSSEQDKNKRAIIYNITNNEETLLEDIPYSFNNGSAIAINENEIALLGVYDDTSGTSPGRLYLYNTSEDKYFKKRVLLGKASSYAKINKLPYLLEERLYGTSPNILTKYNINNSSLYQYGKVINNNSENIKEIANANNDLYLLSYAKLYKANIVVDYKGDGIYVISQETSLSKDLDISNILDVKKIVNEEEQDILVYIGDGTSWKLLNGSDTTQNTNALQYALNFKGEN